MCKHFNIQDNMVIEIKEVNTQYIVLKSYNGGITRNIVNNLVNCLYESILPIRNKKQLRYIQEENIDLRNKQQSYDVVKQELNQKYL